MSYTLLREHRFVVRIGAEANILRIEEQVVGHEVWGGKFRLQIPATATAEAKVIYGETEHEVAKRAAEFLHQRR